MIFLIIGTTIIIIKICFSGRKKKAAPPPPAIKAATSLANLSTTANTVVARNEPVVEPKPAGKLHYYRTITPIPFKISIDPSPCLKSNKYVDINIDNTDFLPKYTVDNIERNITNILDVVDVIDKSSNLIVENTDFLSNLDIDATDIENVDSKSLISIDKSKKMISDDEIENFENNNYKNFTPKPFKLLTEHQKTHDKIKDSNFDNKTSNSILESKRLSIYVPPPPKLPIDRYESSESWNCFITQLGKILDSRVGELV